MNFPIKFTFLMKSEPNPNRKKVRRSAWIIDESKCLSIDEVIKLRETCNALRLFGLQKRRFSQLRNWFMVELGLNTGLRVQEIASLKHSNLILDDGKSSIVVIGKGNKKRSVWISAKFKEISQSYICFKNNFGYSINGDSYLLNNLKGQGITKRALQKFFKAIIKRAGLPEHYHIHNLRHTYSTFFLKASHNNYSFLQDQLGHASITTTQVYATVVESEGRKVLEKLYK